MRLFGRIHAEETRSEIEKLVDDKSIITVYEDGKPQDYSISDLAREAIEKIETQRVTTNE